MPNDDARHFFSELSAEDLPAYTIADAARFLHLPYSTLKFWVRGGSYPTHTGQRNAAPVIELADSSRLSFRNLVEAHVLKALRRRHRISLPHLRQAIGFVRQEFGIDRPLTHPDVAAAGGELLVQRYGQLVSTSPEGQYAMAEVFQAHLRRLEWYQDGAVRCLYPFVRIHADSPRESEPKIVFIDPRRCFGRPAVANGIRTAIVNERFEAGESIVELASDYDCTIDAVEEAIRYERIALYKEAA